MGRIFEARKHTMFARWDKMAKAFTRIGKEISIAVKAAGPDPQANPMLRRVIQNARAVNMPKDKIEGAREQGLPRSPLRRLRAARSRDYRRDRDRQPDAYRCQPS
jgi:transcriptional/translational regulatory protein YebC/TACO1